MSHEWVDQAHQRLTENKERIDVLKAGLQISALQASASACKEDAPIRAATRTNLSRAAKVLSWFGLLSAVAIAVIVFGEYQRLELFSFPLIALAIAQLLILYGKVDSPVTPDTARSQGESPLAAAGRGKMTN